MSSSTPTHTKQWSLGAKTGFDDMKLREQVAIPALSDDEVLVKMHAASLNYRDLIVAMGKYPSSSDNLVPGSDGSGEVIAIGDKVTRFQVGDKVVTLFNQLHLGGPPTPATNNSGLGGARHGVLRQYATFNEHGLVALPSGLSYEEGATLPCAAVTAWNALYGLKALQAGHTVLTQGTGGVSVFAIQFAKAAGATVIATTSSAEKADTLKKMGADHVLNYKETSDWGSKAKELTPNKEGVDFIIEVGGPATFRQSLDAIRLNGVISVIGFLGGMKTDNEPSALECLSKGCIIRGFIVGSRAQFEDMNRAIEANKIKPVIDKKIFKLEELKDAYQYQFDQKHFGKLVVKIS